MDSEYRIDTISPQVCRQILNSYQSVVPAKLSELDVARYQSLPAVVAERKTMSNAYLTLDEVGKLVDWKLAHGKFRPTLKALLKRNTSGSVREITEIAFASFNENKDDAKSSLDQLSKLVGIGPATASLLLSVYAPEQVPFFSDELFRWTLWEDKTGAGWDRPIKYTPKEYQQLFHKVRDLRARIRDVYATECTAVNIEKVAYVLAKRALQPGVENVEDPKMDKSVKISKRKVAIRNQTAAGGDELVPVVGDVGHVKKPRIQSAKSSSEKRVISTRSSRSAQQKHGQ